MIKDGAAVFLVTWKDKSEPLWIEQQFLSNARQVVTDYCSKVSIAVPKLKAQRKKADRVQRNQQYKTQRAGARRSARLAAQNLMCYGYC